MIEESAIQKIRNVIQDIETDSSLRVQFLRVEYWINTSNVARDSAVPGPITVEFQTL